MKQFTSLTRNAEEGGDGGEGEGGKEERKKEAKKRRQRHIDIENEKE